MSAKTFALVSIADCALGRRQRQRGCRHVQTLDVIAQQVGRHLGGGVSYATPLHATPCTRHLAPNTADRWRPVAVPTTQRMPTGRGSPRGVRSGGATSTMQPHCHDFRDVPMKPPGLASDSTFMG